MTVYCWVWVRETWVFCCTNQFAKNIICVAFACAKIWSNPTLYEISMYLRFQLDVLPSILNMIHLNKFMKIQLSLYCIFFKVVGNRLWKPLFFSEQMPNSQLSQWLLSSNTESYTKTGWDGFRALITFLGRYIDIKLRHIFSRQFVFYVKLS